MTFFKPGAFRSSTSLVGGISVERQNDDEKIIQYNPVSHLSPKQQRQSLPIYENRNHIIYLVENYATTVIVGATGCGKTTQIPQYLNEAGWCSGGRVIACTQPRRVAAISVANRVAEEMECTVGEEVGYTIRFDDRTDPEKTKIKFMTDGMLIREMMLDPLLSRYPVIMVDEAHERSVHSDLLLALLKKIQRKRKDLRLIISSATVDAEEFKDFFAPKSKKKNIEQNVIGDFPKYDSVSIISIEGRMYPVDIHYLQTPCKDYIEKTVETVIDIHSNEGNGDILVFLTGQEEIDTVVDLINEKISTNPIRSRRGMIQYLQALPIYSGLPTEQQLKVFRPLPNNTRKVVVATNIAETSITIPGIVFVVDCGFMKIKSYNPYTGIQTLVITEISQASAQQRAGRAGRVKPGKCYRLYSEDSFHTYLSPKSVPEIQRTELSSVILQLKALGIGDIVHFDFISPPPVELMVRALEFLYSVGSIDEKCQLTKPLGTTMAEFPLEPVISKMCITSGEFGCSEEIITIGAMLSVQSVYVHGKTDDIIKKKFAVYEGDQLTFLNVYNGFIKSNASSKWCKENHINYKSMVRVVEIRKQLRKYLQRFHIPLVSSKDTVAIRKCIVSGFFANAAQLQPDGTYLSIKESNKLSLHPNSVLFTRKPPEWVLFYELVLTSKAFMREVIVIEPKWLSELAPHYYEYRTLESARTQASMLANKDNS